MTLTTHVNHLVGVCFFHLRQIRIIRRSLSTDAAHSLVDSSIALLNHVNIVADICFYQLRKQRIIRHSPTDDRCCTLVGSALIHSRVDYNCNGLHGRRYEEPARQVTVRPPCRRQTRSAALTSCVCFRNYAKRVALA